MNDLSSILPLVQGPTGGKGYADQDFLNRLQQQGTERGQGLTSNTLAALKSQGVPINHLDNQIGDFLGEQMGQGAEAFPYVAGFKSPEVETFHDAHPVQSTVRDAAGWAPYLGLGAGGAVAAGKMMEGANRRSAMDNIHGNFSSTDSKTKVPRFDIDTKDESPLSGIFGAAKGKKDPSGEFDTYGRYTDRRYKHVMDELSKNPEHKSHFDKLHQKDNSLLAKGKEWAGKATSTLDQFPSLKKHLGLGGIYEDFAKHVKPQEAKQLSSEDMLRQSGIPESVIAEQLNKTNAKLKGHADIHSALNHLGGRKPKNEEDLADLIRTSLPKYLGGNEQFDPEVMKELLTHGEGGNAQRASSVVDQIQHKMKAYAQPHGSGLGSPEGWAHVGRKVKNPLAIGGAVAAGGLALRPIMKMLHNKIYGEDKNREWLNNMRMTKGNFDHLQQ